MNIINYIIENSTEFVSHGGLLVGFFLVFIECFIPALPLSVFIALNVNAFGMFLGVFISWVATCLGSFLCYLLFYYLSGKFHQKVLNKKTIIKVRNGIDKISNIRFSSLVLLITLPFTPASLINILSGIAGISKKKFLAALLIGKVFSTTFWGYIGKSLIESVTDLTTLIYIGIALLVAYVLSKVVSKRMNIE